jgi:hypothetical protein
VCVCVCVRVPVRESVCVPGSLQVRQRSDRVH